MRDEDNTKPKTNRKTSLITVVDQNEDNRKSRDHQSLTGKMNILAAAFQKSPIPALIMKLDDRFLC